MRPVGFPLLLPWLALILSAACHQQTKSEKGSNLVALVNKVRERERTVLGGEVAAQLQLREKKEEVSAHGQVVLDEGQFHAIAVTDTDEIILIFRTGSVAYFCVTDISGTLRRAFKARPGDAKVYPAAAEEAGPVFAKELGFWKKYFEIAS